MGQADGTPGNDPAGQRVFLWKGERDHELGTGFFVHKINHIS
jgi:hypothetical protein